MTPNQPIPRRRQPPRTPPPRRAPLTPKPTWQNLFQAPRYTDPEIQRQVDEEATDVPPRSSFRR
ncbi:hypothetical protein [Streptomyces sp. NPDC015125]|uniref:hypothetical protein n=1 Tax=Streptomyces sp. NPDC015125 TaxID=3364938 RepID=UPI0036F9BFCC